MKTHGPGDPMCCPTLEVEKRFTVQRNRFLISAEGAKTEDPQITGPVWQWVQTLYNDGSKAVPVDPQNYTVQFREDRTFNVKADCNLKGGTYSTDGKRITIQITHSTMAACPEDSMEDEFVRNLRAGAIFFFMDHDLYLDLKYDTGTMKFSEK
jgi:heat shock protein HslJ